MCGYALARWGGFILPYTAAVVVTCSPRCNAGVCFVTKCEYVPCSLTICRSEYLSSSKQFLSRRRFSCSYPHLSRRFELLFHSPPYPLQSTGVTVVFSSLLPRSLRS